MGRFCETQKPSRCSRDGGARFFRQLSQPFSADYAEALNNADAPGVLKGRQEGGRGLRFLVGVEASETEVVTRGGVRMEGWRRVVGWGCRTNWRFCAQSYSETFEHLFHESAYYVRRRGCLAKEGAETGGRGDGCNETSVLGDVRTYVSTCTDGE